MFTYFLLKKLHDSAGDTSLGELADYVISNVAQRSVVDNHKSQTPTIIPSDDMTGKWKTMKLK
jgi:hypothetical protein